VKETFRRTLADNRTDRDRVVNIRVEIKIRDSLTNLWEEQTRERKA
jgi:hypothetical protein